MTVVELEKELKENKLNSIYLLFGEETFLLESSLKKIKKIFGEILPGINYIQIDDTNIEELIPDIQTPAFGYEKKLIIVKSKPYIVASILHRTPKYFMFFGVHQIYNRSLIELR